MSVRKTNEEFNLINVLIYVVLYLIIVGFFVVFYTLPLIKTFKASQAEYRNNLKHYHLLLNRYEHLKRDFNRKKKKNINVIKNFRNKFNEKDFLSFSKKYFSQSKLIKDSKDFVDSKNEKFIVNRYKMDFSFLKIQNFYSFISDLQKYPSIVKINFPIILEKKDNSKYIEGTWNLEIYETNVSI